MSDKKWKFREDMLCHYVNSVSNRTFQDAEDRLNYLEEKEQLPDMREKIKEYISELDAKIERCELVLRNTNDLITESRLETLIEVKNDLQGRLDELI